MDEKLRWTFSLYDINGDGCITRDEMTDIVTAVYDLMGKFADPNLDPEGVRDRVDRMFQVHKCRFVAFICVKRVSLRGRYKRVWHVKSVESTSTSKNNGKRQADVITSSHAELSWFYSLWMMCSCIIISWLNSARAKPRIYLPLSLLLLRLR